MPEDGFKRKRKKETEFYRTQILQKDELKKKSVPRVCCHCNKIYKIDTWEVDEGKPTGVSHGFCKECYEKMKDKLEEDMKNKSNNKEEEENG
jgi:hypothetical protein